MTFFVFTGWLLWQFAGDQNFKEMFAGDDCGLCASGSGYIVMQKDLNMDGKIMMIQAAMARMPAKAWD